MFGSILFTLFLYIFIFSACESMYGSKVDDFV